MKGTKDGIAGGMKLRVVSLFKMAHNGCNLLIGEERTGSKLLLPAGTGNLLELFAGSRSVGKVGEELGMNVFSVDWQMFEGINLAIDIGEMKKEDVPFVPDIVWASPDCTTYTIAAISTHRNGTEPKSEYAKKCDQVNRHFIGLIHEWEKINQNLGKYIQPLFNQWPQ